MEKETPIVTPEEYRSKLRQLHDQEWAMCSQDFWYWVRHVKTIDEENERIEAFPLNLEYLISLNKDIEEHRQVIVLKSRRMLVSWLMTLRQLHQAQFSGTMAPGAKDSFSGGLFTVDEDAAKYLVKRISDVYYRFPDWMKWRNPMLKDNELYLEFERGGTIKAFPLKRQGPRTFGFSEAGFDEMAFQEAVRTVWAGMIPTLGAKGRLLAVSTPNGKSNLFADVWHNKDKRYDGLYRRKIHWRDNPEHTDKWFRVVTASMEPQDIAREYELSFVHHRGKSVWPEFKTHVHVPDKPELFMVNSDRPMFMGWDLGFHFPAAVWAQRSVHDQWLVQDCLQGYDRSFDDFVEDVVTRSWSFFNPKRNPIIHCMPPDSIQQNRMKSRSGAQNDRTEVANQFKALTGMMPTIRIAPHETGTRTIEGPRLKEVRQLWKLRADGEPGIYISERCEELIEGCQGGYCYPDKGDTEIPDETESTHTQDALQMIVTCYNRMYRTPQAPPQETRRRKIGHRTGL